MLALRRLDYEPGDSSVKATVAFGLWRHGRTAWSVIGISSRQLQGRAMVELLCRLLDHDAQLEWIQRIRKGLLNTQNATIPASNNNQSAASRSTPSPDRENDRPTAHAKSQRMAQRHRACRAPKVLLCGGKILSSRLVATRIRLTTGTAPASVTKSSVQHLAATAAISARQGATSCWHIAYLKQHPLSILCQGAVESSRVYSVDAVSIQLDGAAIPASRSASRRWRTIHDGFREHTSSVATHGRRQSTP
ncbi:hypothetical protein Cob_v011661 [Colletotrichum orbiculare MAFF 240422]|uniref:Uncharacterized protein n=1 Tax=Colletotrichum orbiculare (strain 104-T / ATCC 96160 / CBS 514.97 / LARS 414 / MAFF 240422) TaxID=1213857 RepID=A0A484FAS7_COLOR|nr:hypothetical protein Cob_v011661 [Colletotrichum orbiculare MAFF 240422]